MTALPLHPWRTLGMLLALRAGGRLRALRRRAATPKGLMLTLLGALAFAAFFFAFMARGSHATPMEPESLVAAVTLGTLVMFLSGAFFSTGEKIIAFTPAEVDFLFPGPFTRRQLLLFIMARNIGGELTGAFFISLILIRHTGSWFTGYAAVLLALVFANLLSMAVRLTASAAAVPEGFLRRHGVRIAMLFAVAGYAAHKGLATRLPGHLSWETLRAVINTAFAPLTVFGRVAAADSATAFGLWAVAGVTLNALLVLAVLRLDRASAETLLAASQRVQRLQRVQGEIPSGHATASTAFRFPWAAGCGPNAWRQTVALRRRAGRVLTSAAFAVIVFSALSATLSKTAAAAHSVSAYAFLAPALYFILVNLVRAVAVDFRSDVEQLACLKTLPLTPFQIAAGQLAVPVVTVSAIAAAMLLAAAWIARTPALLLAIPWLVPVTLVLIAIENTAFLLFPSASASGTGDTHAVGRRMVVLFVSSTTLAVLGIAAAGVGAAVALATPPVLWPPYCGAWGIFTLLAAALVWPVAAAFRRYDPSAATAG